MIELKTEIIKNEINANERETEFKSKVVEMSMKELSYNANCLLVHQEPAVKCILVVNDWNMNVDEESCLKKEFDWKGGEMAFIKFLIDVNCWLIE